MAEYVLSSLEGFSDNDALELCKYCSYDIYRIDNEVNKLKYFNKSELVNIFYKLKNYGEYKENNDIIFDLSNGILQRDIERVHNILLKNNDINVFALISILIKSFKNVASIQFYKNPTAELAGLQSKQFWAIKKYNVGRYSNTGITNILNFLTSISYNIKQGNIDTQYLLDNVILYVFNN